MKVACLKHKIKYTLLFDCDSGKMDELLTHDHSELDELLDRIFAALDKSDAEQIYQAIDLFWARLAMHIRAEHLHLFPALIGAFDSPPDRILENHAPSFETVRGAIEELHADHDFFMRELISAIKMTRKARQNIGIDSAEHLLAVHNAIITVRLRLGAHNEREETEVYGWVSALLDRSERADLNAKIQKEIENLPPRFSAR